jgi:hypothetical protein
MRRSISEFAEAGQEAAAEFCNLSAAALRKFDPAHDRLGPIATEFSP